VRTERRREDGEKDRDEGRRTQVRREGQI